MLRALALVLFLPSLAISQGFSKASAGPPRPPEPWAPDATGEDWRVPPVSPGQWYPLPGRAGDWQDRRTVIPEAVRDVGAPPEIRMRITAPFASLEPVFLDVEAAFGTGGVDHFWIEARVGAVPGIEVGDVQFMTLPHTMIEEGRRGARLTEELLPALRPAGTPPVLRRPVYFPETLRARVRYRLREETRPSPFRQGDVEVGEWQVMEVRGLVSAPEAPEVELDFRVAAERHDPEAPFGGWVTWTVEPDPADSRWAQVEEVRYLGFYAPQPELASAFRTAGPDLVRSRVQHGRRAYIWARGGDFDTPPVRALIQGTDGVVRQKRMWMAQPPKGP